MEEKNVQEARAKRNGIVFSSNKIPIIGYETYRDEFEKIQSRIVPVEIDEYLETIQLLNEKGEYISKKKVILFDIILIICCILTKNIWFVLATIYFSITISFDVFEFGKFVYQMKSKNGKENSTARYHAAEHMVINAYDKLQRIPTFDEVKKSSRFSKKCGSRKEICKICMYTVISLAIAFGAEINIFDYSFIVIGTSIFLIMAEYKGWLRFLQILITTPPTNSEIEVAVEGIKFFEKMEEKISSNEEAF